MSRLALSSVSARRARLIQLVKRVVHRASALGPRGGLGRVPPITRSTLASCITEPLKAGFSYEAKVINGPEVKLAHEKQLQLQASESTTSGPASLRSSPQRRSPQKQASKGSAARWGTFHLVVYKKISTSKSGQR